MQDLTEAALLKRLSSTVKVSMHCPLMYDCHYIKIATILLLLHRRHGYEQEIDRIINNTEN